MRAVNGMRLVLGWSCLGNWSWSACFFSQSIATGLANLDMFPFVLLGTCDCFGLNSFCTYLLLIVVTLTIAWFDLTVFVASYCQ